MARDPPTGPPVVVLGAGYAGVGVAREVARRSAGRLPVLLVDRHPVHVLRTELYEVGAFASAPASLRRLAVPIDRVVDAPRVTFRAAEIEGIDLDARTVRLSDGKVPYRSLVVCLGSTIAYYGVPGAAEHTQQVYRLTGAMRLADRLREVEVASARAEAGRRPRVAVVGGGSTGTEVAAEIATAPWTRVAGTGARRPEVTLVAGAVPLLQGLPEGLVRHARALLAKAGVVLSEGRNVVRVEPEHLELQDGSKVEFDVAVWCAGVQAPPVVRGLPVPHGRAGRVRVRDSLDVEGHPELFAVGDVAELADSRTGMIVPATAQAAIAEARVAGANVVRSAGGRPLEAFRYREKGVVVSVGRGKASGTVRQLTIWGTPAAVLKRLTEREYATSARHGRAPPGL